MNWFRMKLRQLEAFRAVMLCATVTRASEMLHISQPATTRLLADLEISLGFALFKREKKRLHPTAEAQALFEEVQRSLLGMDRIARAADEIRPSPEAPRNAPCWKATLTSTYKPPCTNRSAVARRVRRTRPTRLPCRDGHPRGIAGSCPHEGCWYRRLGQRQHLSPRR